MSIAIASLSIDPSLTDKKKKAWIDSKKVAPVYQCFKVQDAELKWEGDCLYHWFPCGALKCKENSSGIRHWPDVNSGTGNLTKHAKCCWGENIFKSLIKGAPTEPTESIHAVFGHQMATKPAKGKPLTYAELR